MALDLEKLANHLQSGDEDMAVLALRTFVKISVASSLEERPLLETIHGALKTLVQSDEHEVRFFARQALEKVADLAKEAGGPLEPETPSSGPNLPGSSGTAAAIAPGLTEVAKLAIDAVGSRSWPGVMTTEASRAMIKLNALAGATADEQAALQVAEMFAAARDPWIRATCVSTLGKIGAKTGLRTLVVALRDTDARVRANAVEAAPRITPRNRCIKVFMEAAADTDPRVRANGLKGLAEVDRAKVFLELSRLVDSDKISARATAVHVLGAIPDPTALPLLERLASDEAEEIRMRVVDALSGRNCLEAVGIVRKLVNDMDIDVAERALEVYERRKYEAGLLDSKELSLAIIQEEVARVDAENMAAQESPSHGEAPPGLAEPVEAAAQAPAQAPAPAPPAHDPPSPRGARAPEGVGPGPTPAAEGEGEPGQSPTDDDPRWPEPPEVAEPLHALYDEIDELLAAMGKKIVALEKTKGFRGGGHFDKTLYNVRRYEDMLEKRREAASKVGFWAKFVRRGGPASDPGMIEVEGNLFEQHRELGEVAIGLLMEQNLRFPQLYSEYNKIDALLAKAEALKKGGHR